MILTCIEEGRNGHTANQVFEEEALPSDENGYEGCQGIMEGQIANLKDESTSINFIRNVATVIRVTGYSNGIYVGFKLR